MKRDQKQARKWQEKMDRLDEGDFPPPPLPGEKPSLEFEEWYRAKKESDREEFEETLADNVRQLNERPGNRFPAVPDRSYTLSKSSPRVCLIARPWYRSGWPVDLRRKGDAKARLGPLFWSPRLVVTGLGTRAPGLRRRRLGIVDMTALGFRGELAKLGITCDGEMTLPDTATHVWLRLNDLEAVVTVTIDGETSHFAERPAAWIARRSRTTPEPSGDD